MEKTILSCDSCDAFCTIQHDMDSEYYPVSNCPFCGEEVEEDSNIEEWEENDDD